MRSTSNIDDFQRLMGLPETPIRLSDVGNCTMTSLVGIVVVMTNQIRSSVDTAHIFMSISSSGYEDRQIKSSIELLERTLEVQQIRTAGKDIKQRNCRLLASQICGPRRPFRYHLKGDKEVTSSNDNIQ